jgi:L-alanine-DL-glutamate epimerase-like enolase superfamily enzyme
LGGVVHSSFGFETIKIKVSGQLDSDLDMILVLKALVPETSRFILDGNQGFTVAIAERLVDRLIAFGIKPLFFEQPLPEDDVKGVEELSQSLPIPLCLDESIRTVRDLQKFLHLGLRPMVNIKLMKTGIEQSRLLIAMAQKTKLVLMMGGMFESEVAMGISLQMALGTAAITYADLDTPFFLKERLTKASPWHAKSARLQQPQGFGHGLERLVSP